jgi:uncharacterized membrane protein
MTWLLGVWNKFQAWIIGVLAIIAAIFAVYLKGRSAGKESEKLKQREADDAATARKNSVLPATADDTVDRLRDGKF